MKLNLFNNLYNHIILENSETKIIYNTFDYIFKPIAEDKTECTWKSIDKTSNKLISITATIFKNNTYEFAVTDETNKPKKYTDKEFLLAYYNEYQNFKHVLSEYKQQMLTKLNETKNKQNEKFEIQDGKTIEKIINFNDALMQENDLKNGTLISTNGIDFVIKHTDDDKYKNLITISFEFQNENPIKKETDLLYYDVIALAKITNLTIKILNINLYDSDNLKSSTPIETLIESEFKQKFLTIYFALKETLTKYFEQVKIENQF